MEQILNRDCTTKLHYKNGILKLAFYDEKALVDIHTYKKTVANLHEVFILYKNYKRFVDEMGWHLIAAYLAKYYGIDIQGKSFNQVIKEIGIAQQKEIDKDEECKKY